MDITEGTPERLRIGIEGLLKGDPLIYHQVVFQKSFAGSPLVIASFSACIQCENATAEEARQMIDRSKLVFEALKELSPEVASLAEASIHRYEFCFDTGKGAFVLATLEHGQVKWLG